MDEDAALAELRQAIETLKVDVERLQVPPSNGGDQGGADLRVVVKEGNARIAEILQEAASRR
jgi:hypothetical protein